MTPLTGRFQPTTCEVVSAVLGPTLSVLTASYSAVLTLALQRRLDASIPSSVVWLFYGDFLDSNKETESLLQRFNRIIRARYIIV